LRDGIQTATCYKPIFGVMGFLQRIANTSVTGCKHAVAFASKRRFVQFYLHQLIHVPEHKHVAVKLHNTVILDKGERRKLAPAVIKSRVLAVILLHRWQKIFHSLGGDTT
jgi:hypothetical protein